ncbi:hypothetical protein GCM10009850_071540 [Nonomuraea monospora]|uniref:Uncharacterized protein n=1 Tax=Nonomuraea monospora TaxID=568818 RepID=A0ABN3CQI3_9ACTN
MRTAVLLTWTLLSPLLGMTPAPAISLDRAQAAAGETITVTLSGWPQGNVLIELCGNDRRAGSADCAVSTGVTTVVLTTGTATASLTLAPPPAACPCVIAATGVTAATTVTTPVTLTGAPQTAAPSTAPARLDPKLTIVNTSLPDGPSWWWLFGLSGTTPLEITIRNDGAAPATDPPITLASGPKGAPGATITPPELGTIQPGEQRTVRVEVPLEAPVFGAFEVSGTIQDAVLRTGDSVYPLGLLALLAVPLHLTTAWIVFSVRVPSP